MSRQGYPKRPDDPVIQQRPATTPARLRDNLPDRHGGSCISIVVVMLIVTCLGGAYAYSNLSSALNRISSARDVRPTAIAASPPPAFLQSPFNVLVIGVDLRPEQLEEGARSDTLIVVHVDPVERWASLLSIPRDTLVTIPAQKCGGRSKINDAYSCGYDNPSIYGTGSTSEDSGAALAADTVEDFLGITINYTVQVDFEGFKELIDTLDGITVDVPRAILDPEYPTEDLGYMRLYIPTGLQHMDGITALRYARTRHTDNDFGRAGRQQQVLQAILQVVKEQNLFQRFESAPRMLNVLSQNVRTTAPINDLGTLRNIARLAQNFDSDRIQQLVLRPEVNPDGSSSLLSDLSGPLEWDPDYIERIVQQLQSPPSATEATSTVIQGQNTDGRVD
jgi:LCP family protein required for cell wall assembly